MDNPRIGLLHYSYPPVVGGVENVVQQQARMFKRFGKSVTIITGEGDEDSNDIKTVVIPELQSLGKNNPELRTRIATQVEYPEEFFPYVESIYEKLVECLSDIDVLIIHNILNSTLNIPLNAALIKYISENPGKKYIAWVHDVALEEHIRPNTFPNPAIELYIYKEIPNVYYVAISQNLKNTLTEKLHFPEQNIRVVHNGIDIADFLRLRDKTKVLIDNFHLYSRDIILFMPTKIIPYKNIEKGIDLLKMLKKEFDNPVLLISGSMFPHSQNSKNKEYYDQILNQIESSDLTQNVVLLSEYINNEKDSYEIVSDIYRLSDFILYPTQFENFGLPVLEAAVAKTPILCNTLPVFREIDTDNVFYFDFNNGNIEEAAKLVSNFVKSNSQIRLFKSAKSTFNLSAIFKREILPLVEINN